MVGFLLRAAITALGLWVASELLSGMTFDAPFKLILAAIVLGVINAFVRPLAFILTLPITIVTLGLFLLVLNAGMVALVAWLDYLKTADLAPLTMHRYEATLRSFTKGCESDPVQALDGQKMNEFINPSDETKVGTRTAKRMALVSFFRFCSASGFILGNPADLVKVRTHELDHAQMETTRKVPVGVLVP
jgi:uncharacterized membrane protein YvlD (DUF360 family)